MTFKRSALVALALAVFASLVVAGVATARHTYPKVTVKSTVAFVPAYTQATASGAPPVCDAPFTITGNHAGPLTGTACRPVKPTSDVLTTGTRYGTGPFQTRDDGITSQFAQQMNSYATIQTCNTNAMCLDGSAPDINVTANLTDVRCKTTGSGAHGVCNVVMGDYTGALILAADIRITDHRNVGTGPGTACNGLENCTGTVEDLVFQVPIGGSGGGGCATTDGQSLAIGSTCTVSTTVNTVGGGNVVITGSKGNTELDNIRVVDPGPGFNLGTPENNGVYLKQGVFTP